MTETIDLAALTRASGPHVLLASGTVSQAGSGTDFAGWSDVSSVYVEAKAELRDGSRGYARLVLTVEGSADGLSWSALETFTFGGHGGRQEATVDAPDDHLRVSWSVEGRSEWQIVSVTATPSIVDPPGGGGGGSLPLKGPITVAIADVPDDQDTFEVYTPADGALIADILISAQDWDQGAQADLYDGDPGTGMLLGAGSEGALVDFQNNESETDDFGARAFISIAALTGGADADNFPYRSTGEPITLKMTYATATGGITDVDQGTKTFTSIDYLGNLSPGAVLTISGSTGNDGTYTVASVTDFTVTVVEAIPNATADGTWASPLIPTTGETQFLIDDRGVPVAP